MLKTYLQKLLNLTAKKGADGSFPNYDGQLYGSTESTTFSYVAPADGDFIFIPKIQRGVFYELCLYTATNKVLVSRFQTDETVNTKSYTSYVRLNKGETLKLESVSGTYKFAEWRFFPAKL